MKPADRLGSERWQANSGLLKHQLLCLREYDGRWCHNRLSVSAEAAFFRGVTGIYLVKLVLRRGLLSKCEARAVVMMPWIVCGVAYFETKFEGNHVASYNTLLIGVAGHVVELCNCDDRRVAYLAASREDEVRRAMRREQHDREGFSLDLQVIADWLSDR
eukprot:1192946-Prorocentrum_minimum.AAC.3